MWRLEAAQLVSSEKGARKRVVFLYPVDPGKALYKEPGIRLVYGSLWS